VVPGGTSPITIGTYTVDEGFLDAIGMKLLAGRWFDRNRPLDDFTLPFPLTDASQQAFVARGVNIVINELAVKRLGFKSPADAIGKTVRAGLVDDKIGLVPATIVGVVGDARFRSVKQPLEPLMFEDAKAGQQLMVVRFHGDP